MARRAPRMRQPQRQTIQGPPLRREGQHGIPPHAGGHVQPLSGHRRGERHPQQQAVFGTTRL